MAVAELILIRHGESLGNAAQAELIVIDQRDADVPLSPVGPQQAQALGPGLQTLLSDGLSTTIWLSPYVRAYQTAEVALATVGLPLPVGGAARTPGAADQRAQAATRDRGVASSARRSARTASTSTSATKESSCSQRSELRPTW